MRTSHWIVMLFASLPLAGAEAFAQPYGAGPAGSIPGSSMAGRVRGVPRPDSGVRIPNADVFGDEFEERAFGRDVDDSYLRPKVGNRNQRSRSIEERATDGRSELGTINSGAFARQGPGAIGGSSVTRGANSGRVPHLGRGGRARIVPSQR